MTGIKKIALKFWDSPTFTTWGSFFSKSLYAVLLLPVITTVLSKEDITVWLMFNIFIGLQNIGDLGFGVTFIRVMSYAMGGATDIPELGKNEKIKRTEGINWKLIERSDSTTKYILFYTSLVFILIISVAGYFSLKKPVSFTIDQGDAWLSFIIILGTSFIKFNGNRYSIFLQGVNYVAMLRRWEAIISVFSIIAGFFVAVYTRSLLYLIINQQIWVIVQVLVNRFQCGNIFEGRFKKFKPEGIDRELFRTTFPVAWKSWVGILMSYGVVQASGLVVAQIENTASVASYLFSLKILDIIRNFSNAPFYSKIPLYNRLFIEGNRNGLLVRIRNGMGFSMMIFVLSVIFIGVAGQPLLKLIGSNVTMVSSWIWIAMVFAYFFERYGGMHLQFYSISNDIVWHIANGVSGSIFIGLSFLFVTIMHWGIISFPVALLISNLSFFTWYSARKSYKFFKLDFINFEYKTSFYPFLLMVIYLVASIIFA